MGYDCLKKIIETFNIKYNKVLQNNSAQCDTAITILISAITSAVQNMSVCISPSNPLRGEAAIYSLAFPNKHSNQPQ